MGKRRLDQVHSEEHDEDMQVDLEERTPKRVKLDRPKTTTRQTTVPVTPSTAKKEVVATKKPTTSKVATFTCRPAKENVNSSIKPKKATFKVHTGSVSTNITSTLTGNSPFQKSTIEKVNDFHNAVPSRFKTKPDPLPSAQEKQKWSQRMPTIPKSPRMGTSSRTKAAKGDDKPVLKPFKALPLNRKILEAGFAGYSGVPKVVPKKTTVPVEFKFKSGPYSKKKDAEIKTTIEDDDDKMDTSEETFDDRVDDGGIFQFRPAELPQLATLPSPAVPKRPTIKRNVTPSVQKQSVAPVQQEVKKVTKSVSKISKPLAEISSSVLGIGKPTGLVKKPPVPKFSGANNKTLIGAKKDENAKPVVKTVSRPSSRLIAARI